MSGQVRREGFLVGQAPAERHVAHLEELGVRVVRREPGGTRLSGSWAFRAEAAEARVLDRTMDHLGLVDDLAPKRGQTLAVGMCMPPPKNISPGWKWK